MDYKNMLLGDRIEMPVLTQWEGRNQDLFREITVWCRTQEHRPQFEIENDRFAPKEIRFWLKRIR